MSLGEKKEVLLKLLALEGKDDQKFDSIKGSPRVMKELFLTQENSTLDMFKFEAYKLGPVCFEVHDHLDELEEEGLVNIERDEDDVKTFSLTKEGKDKVEDMEIDLRDDITEEMRDKKQMINEMDFQEMISYVYTNYPDTTKKSEVKWMA